MKAWINAYKIPAFDEKNKEIDPAGLAIGHNKPAGPGWVFTRKVEVLCPKCLERIDNGEHLLPVEVVVCNNNIRSGFVPRVSRH